MKENDMDVHYNNMNLDEVVENICNHVEVSEKQVVEEPTLSAMKERYQKNKKGKDKDFDTNVVKKSKNKESVIVGDGREEVHQSSGESAKTRDLMKSPLFNQFSEHVALFFATCGRKYNKRAS